MFDLDAGILLWLSLSALSNRVPSSRGKIMILLHRASGLAVHYLQHLFDQERHLKMLDAINFMRLVASQSPISDIIVE